MANPRRSEEKDILQSALAGPADQDEDTITPQKPTKSKKKPIVRPQLVGPKEAMITYIPLEQGDEAFTIWHGIKFSANVPRKVTNRELITSAITNPWFSVDGKPPAKRHMPPPPRDTADDARSVVIDEKQEVEVEDVLSGDVENVNEDVD
jgi:hypothetical protein